MTELVHAGRMPIKRLIWISYDLGLRGDYESLYAWLDEHGARDCGDSLAVLEYEVKRDLLKELKADIGEIVSANKRARLYVIHLDPVTKKMKGTFLFGRRKSAPWVGHAGGVGEEDEAGS